MTFFQCIFPECLRLAVVTPIKKEKNGDLNKFKNYIPVSSLPFMSKILEKIMYNQLIRHLEKHLFPPPISLQIFPLM